MDIESYRTYCLSLPYATEEMPFGESWLVFKVGGKIFSLIALERQPLSISLKCDPDMAIDLRDRYDCVVAGYHLNKKHWNTITLSGQMPREEIEYWVRHSYQLVWQRLTRKMRDVLPLPQDDLSLSV